MDEREIEFRERNEKNKAWHKRMKIYYFGVYAPWAVIWLFVFLIIDPKINPKIWIWIMGAIFVAWVLWVIFGTSLIRCPHCSARLNRANPWNIRYCPFCATDMKVYEYYEREKL